MEIKGGEGETRIIRISIRKGGIRELKEKKEEKKKEAEEEEKI